MFPDSVQVEPKENPEMEVPFLPVRDRSAGGAEVAAELIEAVCGIDEHAGREGIIGECLEPELHTRIALEVLRGRPAAGPCLADVSVKRRVQFVEVELEEAQVDVLEQGKAVGEVRVGELVPAHRIERVSLHPAQPADVEVEKLTHRRRATRPPPPT